jgi:integrase
MTELSVVGRWTEHRDRLLEEYKLTWLYEDDPKPSGSPVTLKGNRKGEKPKNAGKRYPASPPTPAEVMRMLALCGTGYVGRRNHALIACMWRSGLRVSEALALRPYHVDFDDNTITVMSGKGGKRRVVGIDPWGAEQIKAWITKRKGLPVVQDAPLFCTVSQPNPGGPVNTAYVREMVREIAKRAEVPRRVAPHQLRHACAVFMARNNMPMHLIQRQLGHSNLGTTATYLQGIAPFEVVLAMTALPAPEGAEDA